MQKRGMGARWQHHCSQGQDYPEGLTPAPAAALELGY